MNNLTITPSDMLKALADPTRLRMAVLLTKGERCICDLTACLKLPQSTVSRHMARLKAAGIVNDRRTSRWVYYSLQSGPLQSELLQLLQKNLTNEEPFSTDCAKLQELIDSGRCDGGICCPSPGQITITQKNGVSNTMTPAKVLVLCTGNSCRSQMAEGFLRHYGNDAIEAYSAGTHPKPIHPLAIQVMQEVGIDISGHTSNYVFEYLDKRIDYVISVCSEAEKECPFFPGNVKRLHWPFDDPAKAEGTDEVILSEFQRIRDEIGARFRTWVEEELKISQPS